MSTETSTARGVEPTRRERQRAATREEILGAGRRLLVAGGPTEVTLRAIARELGMTAPALYRYFGSHEDLLTALIAQVYADLTEALEQARDDHAGDDVATRMLVVSRAFRRWALDHREEFALVFGSPLPGYEAPDEGLTDEGGREFGTVFLDLFAELWAERPFPVRPPEELDPGLVAELRCWVPEESPLPLGAIEIYLRCWVRLYGAVTMEAFGHVKFAMQDAYPLFELELRGLAEMLGISDAYRPPAR